MRSLVIDQHDPVAGDKAPLCGNKSCGRPSSTTRRRSAGNPRVSGFTLIELLVVISIIALLIAMLLPVLRNARDAGKQLVCASNMRQVATAALAYTNEYKEQLPPFTDNGGPPWYARYIYLVLSPYVGFDWQSEWATTARFLAWRKGRNVYWCPGISPDEQDSRFLDGSIWTYYYSTYGYNLNISPDYNVKFRKITEYSGHESSSVLFYEWRIKQLSEGGVFLWDPYISSPVVQMNLWSQFIIDKPAHNGRNYFSFMDGHVQGVKTRLTYSDYITNEMRWLP